MIINSICEVLKKSFLKHAKLPALKIGEKFWNYEEIYSDAIKLANWLKLSASKPKMIGILASRSKTAYTAVISSLFSGCSFVPLNKNFPLERTLMMIQSAEIDVLIVDAGSLASLNSLLENVSRKPVIICPEGDPSQLESELSVITQYELGTSANSFEFSDTSVPEDIAYLLFTSGSTGIPKGVPISLRNLFSFVYASQKKFYIQSFDRVSQTFDLTFDLAIFDILMTWCHGACLCAMQTIDLLAPTHFVRENKITVWFSVPSVISLARKKNILHPDSMPSLRLSLFCGEALSVQNAQAWQQAAPQSVIENLYGPTEFTIACMSYRFNSSFHAEDDLVPIGKPYEGVTAKVLDKNGEEKNEGELWLSGPQMFRGYWKNEVQTKSVITHKSGYSYYRTGDRVKILSDGNIYYLGRFNDQIKVNGYRIELSEVESCIRKYPTVNEVAVFGWPQEEGNYTGLIAFVTGEDCTEKEILEFIKLKLPSYMLPNKIKCLKFMPLNSNGKIDKKYLKLSLCDESPRLHQEIS